MWSYLCAYISPTYKSCWISVPLGSGVMPETTTLFLYRCNQNEKKLNLSTTEKNLGKKVTFCCVMAVICSVSLTWLSQNYDNAVMEKNIVPSVDRSWDYVKSMVHSTSLHSRLCCVRFRLDLNIFLWSFCFQLQNWLFIKYLLHQKWLFPYFSCKSCLTLRI